VVKYALDTYATDNGASLSCTHDANAWPSDRFAGLPAPRPDERVVLWLQNSHAVPIPPGRWRWTAWGPSSRWPSTGDGAVRHRARWMSPTFLPGLHWPAQIELRAGRHVVRPRYEVTRTGASGSRMSMWSGRICAPIPASRALHPALGRGYLLPFPILPRGRFRTIVQPTPMAQQRAEPAAAAGCVRARRHAGAGILSGRAAALA
jgi:hypothetical protein